MNAAGRQRREEGGQQHGLSNTGMLRLAREMKELKRDPPDVLYAIRLNEERKEPDTKLDKDGRSTHVKYTDENPPNVSSGVGGSGSSDDTSGEMRVVIRGPDGM